MTAVETRLVPTRVGVPTWVCDLRRGDEISEIDGDDDLTAIVQDYDGANLTVRPNRRRAQPHTLHLVDPMDRVLRWETRMEPEKPVSPEWLAL